MLSSPADTRAGWGRLRATDVTILHRKAAADVKRLRASRLFTCRWFNVTCTVLTGLRAPQEVHPEDATTRRERPNATGIDADSDPDQYGAVCKDLRGSVYPHPRTGHKGASRSGLWGAGATPRGRGRDFYWCGPVSSASQLFRTLKTPVRGQCRGRWRPGGGATHSTVSGEGKGLTARVHLQLLDGPKSSAKDSNELEY